MMVDCEEYQYATFAVIDRTYCLPEDGDTHSIQEWKTLIANYRLTSNPLRERSGLNQFTGGAVGLLAGVLIGIGSGGLAFGVLLGTLGLFLGSSAPKFFVMSSTSQRRGSQNVLPSTGGVPEDTAPVAPVEPKSIDRREQPLLEKGLPQALFQHRFANTLEITGLSLSQVSKRTGFSIKYLTDLYSGKQPSPPEADLSKLAAALRVTIPYLTGHIGPTTLTLGSMVERMSSVATIWNRFRDHHSNLTENERQKLEGESFEYRFSYVVQFICREFPHLFTHIVVADCIGIHPRSLTMIMEGDCSLTPIVLDQMAALTGIPVSFFGMGRLEGGPFTTNEEMVTFLSGAWRKREPLPQKRDST